MSKVRPSKFLAYIFALSIISFAAISPIQQRVKAASTDFSAKPLGNVTQPAKGQSYTDPAFGTKILRLTDGNDGGIATVAYSYWPVFNMNSTRLMLALDWAPYLYNFNPSTLTFQKVGPIFPSAS